MSKDGKKLFKQAVIYNAAARVKITPRWWNWWNPFAWRKAKLAQHLLHQKMQGKYEKTVNKLFTQAQRERLEAVSSQKVEWDKE